MDRIIADKNNNVFLEALEQSFEISKTKDTHFPGAAVNSFLNNM